MTDVPATLESAPVEADEPGGILNPPPAPLSAPHRTLMHNSMSVVRFFTLHGLGVVFPLTAALLMYVWRAIIVIAGVTGAAALAVPVWRRIGRRGIQVHFAHALWLALLLALMLPVHLAGDRTEG